MDIRPARSVSGSCAHLRTVVRLAVTVGFATSACSAQPAVVPISQAESARLESHVFSRVAPAVVRIHSSAGFGSGFFVREDGLILTNAHVVRSDETVDVVMRDGRRVRGKVVERALEKIDLALVKIDERAESLLPLAGHAAPGAWVAAVGYGNSGEWDFQAGRITRVFPKGTLRPVIQSAIYLTEGSSGTPLVDSSGNVLGVVTAALLPGIGEVVFAIRADVALQSLRTLTESCDCVVVEAPEKIQVYVDGVRAGRGPWVAFPAVPGRYDIFAVVDGTLRRARVSFPDTRKVDLTAP